MTPLELDFQRAKLLEGSPALRALVIARPLEYVFDGRANADKLARLQLQFDELRALFVTSKSPARVRELAEELPRIYDALGRAATGWRDARGVVHRFAIHNPDFSKDAELGELEGSAA